MRAEFALVGLCALALVCKIDAAPRAVNMDCVVRGFTSDKYNSRICTTNDIAALMAASANEHELAACRLMKAALLLECSEIEFNDAAYDEATNLCAAVEASYESCIDEWPLHAARLLQIQAFAQGNLYDAAFSSATNAASSVPQTGVATTNTEWTALFGTEIPARISLTDAFRANAAAARMKLDPTADITSLTNGIPSFAMTILLAP